jgi:hypothetical protein
VAPGQTLVGLALVTFVAAVFTPQVIGAHSQPEAVRQAFVTGFRPALFLAAAFAFLGACISLEKRPLAALHIRVMVVPP